MFQTTNQLIFTSMKLSEIIEARLLTTNGLKKNFRYHGDSNDRSDPNLHQWLTGALKK